MQYWGMTLSTDPDGLPSFSKPSYLNGHFDTLKYCALRCIKYMITLVKLFMKGRRAIFLIHVPPFYPDPNRPSLSEELEILSRYLSVPTDITCLLQWNQDSVCISSSTISTTIKRLASFYSPCE